MSQKLEKALAMRQVLVKKKVSGEVVIHFNDNKIKDVVLNHGGVTDILARRGVTLEAIRKSNLKQLINSKAVEVI